MKNSEVAEAFANGETEAFGSHVFIGGNVIYSWGLHFPMAIRLDDGFLINKSKYSPSTSKHQYYVRQALAGRTIVMVNTLKLDEVIMQGITSLLEYYAGLI